MREHLAKLRQVYAAKLPAYLDAIERAIDAGAPVEVRERAHRVRGSAGSYGFPEVSRAMAKIEGAVREAEEAGAAPDWQAVRTWLAEARVAAGTPLDS
ncbi:MAG: Hpt domain-containing protein [Deltaproteobacteria bacterium]|nr:MAG: Hpt domain-containing protein [Deltaproteobacteria bacterium]